MIRLTYVLPATPLPHRFPHPRAAIAPWSGEHRNHPASAPLPQAEPNEGGGTSATDLMRRSTHSSASTRARTSRSDHPWARAGAGDYGAHRRGEGNWSSIWIAPTFIFVKRPPTVGGAVGSSRPKSYPIRSSSKTDSQTRATIPLGARFDSAMLIDLDRITARQCRSRNPRPDPSAKRPADDRSEVCRIRSRSHRRHRRIPTGRREWSFLRAFAACSPQTAAGILWRSARRARRRRISVRHPRDRRPRTSSRSLAHACPL